MTWRERVTMGLSVVVAATATVALAPMPGKVLAQPPSATGAPHATTAPTTSVPAQVVVIIAREVAGAIDPRLAGLSALREPPFSAFHSMDIWSEHSLTLTQGVPVTVDLPNGRVIQLVLEEVTGDGRNHVRVSINRREQSDYLPVLEVAAPPGDPFFVAGQNFMGGTLVIGVSLGHREGAPVMGSPPRLPPPTTPPTHR